MLKIKFFIFFYLALGCYGQDSVCGGKLFIDNSAVIEVPQSSSAMADCEWIIETHPNRILLFSTSNIKYDNHQDFLSIYDGPSDSSSKILLEKNSKNEAKSSVYSTSSSVLVRLRRSLSNPPSLATIFQLKIEKAVSCPPNLGGLDTSCARVVDDLSCYCVSTTLRNWTSSLQFCYHNVMQLVAIETDVEDRALYNAWGQYTGAWISLTDQILEGDWLWYTTLMTLSQTRYSNWLAGEPNQSFKDENCGCYTASGFGWNDGYCDFLSGCICENQP